MVGELEAVVCGPTGIVDQLVNNTPTCAILHRCSTNLPRSVPTPWSTVPLACSTSSNRGIHQTAHHCMVLHTHVFRAHTLDFCVHMHIDHPAWCHLHCTCFAATGDHINTLPQHPPPAPSNNTLQQHHALLPQTKHLLQLQALCPDACTLSWTRTPPPAEGGRPQWALVVMLHDQGGAPHAAQGITSPRSPSARLSRCQTQQLQQAQLRTRLALLVLEELHARHGVCGVGCVCYGGGYCIPDGVVHARVTTTCSVGSTMHQQWYT